jgi:hypothetical protein
MMPHNIARTGGVRTGSQVSPMTASCCASRWRCGTDTTRFSRTGCSGLNNSEGNHGEDVKEYYFYLDSTPTHSYMKYLYKYPQSEYPYVPLIQNNQKRDKQATEYELLDTGIFDADRYFDVFVEYAKAEPEDILVQVTVCNRGPDPAEIHVLPTVLQQHRVPPR